MFPSPASPAAKQVSVEPVREAVARLRQHTQSAGRGRFRHHDARTGARRLRSVADAVVVGSAIVNRIAANLDAQGKAKTGLIDDVLAFVATSGKCSA